MDTSRRLPFFGVGPYYFTGVVALAAGFFLLGTRCPELCLAPDSGWRWACRAAGAVMMALGAILWLGALVGARLARNIAASRLVTAGVYAWVRNPIYSAFIFLGSGALTWQGSVLAAAHFLLGWLTLTVMVRLTEEKWLRAKFGDAYTEYCGRVNRCLPWFPSGPRR